MTTNTAWMPQPFTVTTEVPLLRSSTALPIPWADLVKAAEDALKADKGTPAQFIPKAFWVKVRMKPEADVTTEAVRGWLKAAFTGWRAGEEKRNGGELVPFMTAVVESEGTVGGKDKVEGHTLYIVPQDVEAREAAINRAKKTAKTRKAPAKARKTPGGQKSQRQAAE